MKKVIVILLCLAMACFFSGFYIATLSTDNVFVGLFIMGIGLAISLSATIPIAMLTQKSALSTRLSFQRCMMI